MADCVVAAIGLGSNVGDRRTHLDRAIALLARHLGEMRASSIRETDPVGVPHEQPQFLNAAVVGTTTLSAAALLETLGAIEREAGRERPYAGAPRTLDLDLILYGTQVIDEPGLVVPHPRFRERRFVLEPLAEIAPGLQDPVTGRTVAELLRGVGPNGESG